MHERYEDQKIREIWSNKFKLDLWQLTELAVLQAKENLGKIPLETTAKISEIFQEHPIDIDWWKKRDGEINHDLNAFLEERMRWLPPKWQKDFHEKMTSYDTEEPAFASMLRASVEYVLEKSAIFKETLKSMAKKYRFVVMFAETHGQDAQVQSFGKRCLCWLQDLNASEAALTETIKNLRYSKLSGAVENYRISRLFRFQ